MNNGKFTCNSKWITDNVNDDNDDDDDGNDDDGRFYTQAAITIRHTFVTFLWLKTIRSILFPDKSKVMLAFQLFIIYYRFY